MTRESYLAAADRLEDQVAGATPEELAGLGEDILAVAGVLTREPRLRRALSDPARTGTERADLLRGLLAGKVGEPAVDLSAALVEGRWSSGGELLGATERLGVTALLAGAEKAGTLADVEDELFRFGQIVDGDPRLAVAIADGAVPVAYRVELARNLLTGKADPTTVRLAELAVTGFGGRGIHPSLIRLVELTAQRRDRSVAYVTAAVPLTEAEERRLGDRLAELYGREVTLKITVDPRVLGGLSVHIGHDRYDGTVARRLSDTRNALAGRK